MTRLANASGQSVQTAKWATLGKKRNSLTGKTDAGPFHLKGPKIQDRVGEIVIDPAIADQDDGPVILIHPPLAHDEVPPGMRNVASTRSPVFTFTSKMSAPSFSIPAGPLQYGGTCPAANIPKAQWGKIGGQVLAEGGFSDQAALAAGRRLESSKAQKGDELLGSYICDSCYAGKSRFAMYDTIPFHQMIRKFWSDKALARGSFADEMTAAIIALTGNNRLFGRVQKDASRAHFRIHDSGDFYSIPYFLAWVEVCRRLPEILFWAPTRQWAVNQEWRVTMANAVAGVKNLALRPSALVYGSQAPLVPGLAAGSTASPSEVTDHWECPAYLSDLASCASAGCRTCWDSPQKPVNYHAH